MLAVSQYSFVIQAIIKQVEMTQFSVVRKESG